MAVVAYQFVKFNHNLTDDLLRLSGLKNRGFFQLTKGKNLSPTENAILLYIRQITHGYNKSFEHLYINEIVENLGMARRTAQRNLASLCSKGILLKYEANNKVNKRIYGIDLSNYPYATIAEVFNIERSRIEYLYTKDVECNSRGVSNTTLECVGGCHSDTHKNKKHIIKTKSIKIPDLEGQESNSQEVFDMKSLEELVEQGLNKNKQGIERKKQKALKKSQRHRYLNFQTINAVFKSAFMERFPDSYTVCNLSVKQQGIAKATLSRLFRSDDGIDIEAATKFIEWCVNNWGYVVDDMRTWYKPSRKHELPEVPDLMFLVNMKDTFMRHMKSKEVKQTVIDKVHSLDPIERYRKELELKGYDPEDIDHIIQKRRKHIVDGDKLEKLKRQNQEIYDRLIMAKRTMYSTYMKAAKAARKESGAGLSEKRTNPLVGQEVEGPDGKMYPAEVMLFFNPAPWCEDPDEMQRLQDEQFLKAVEEFELNKDKFHEQ